MAPADVALIDVGPKDREMWVSRRRHCLLPRGSVMQQRLCSSYCSTYCSTKLALPTGFLSPLLSPLSIQ